MKTNRIISGILFIFMTWLTACDYLDVVPPNIITDEQAYSTESGVMAALTTLYRDLPKEDNRYGNGSFYNGEYSSNHYGNLETNVGLARNRKQEDQAGFGATLGATWWNYSAIRNINRFIENIRKSTMLSETKKSAYEGEALALRAWCYFAMAKRYGGVPIIDRVLTYNGPESIPELEIPRASEKETWDFIIADIDAALKTDIPESPQDGRMGRYAALTVKAQAALYAASIAKYNDITVEDPNTGKLLCGIPVSEYEAYYQTAFNACDKVIKSGKYELARNLNASNLSENFRTLFLKPGNHKEAIFTEYFFYPDYVYDLDNFCIPWGRANFVSAAPTVELLEKYEYLDGRPGTEGIPAIGAYSARFTDRTDFFAGRDARMLATIMIPGETYMNRVVDIKYGEIDATGTEQTGPSFRGIYGMGADTQTPTSMFRKKHLDDSREHSLTTKDSDQPFILLRYAEVLLMAAEAKVELGDRAGAKPYINDIRTRAGLKEIDAVTLDEIRRQWDCEMVYENKSYWNYRRWRILDDKFGSPFRPRGLYPLFDTRSNRWVYKTGLISTDVVFQNKFYYHPIDGGEIAKNPKLIQNYGY